jgi:hypothetical protein
VVFRCSATRSTISFADVHRASRSQPTPAQGQELLPAFGPALELLTS